MEVDGIYMSNGLGDPVAPLAEGWIIRDPSLASIFVVGRQDVETSICGSPISSIQFQSLDGGVSAFASVCSSCPHKSEPCLRPPLTLLNHFLRGIYRKLFGVCAHLRCPGTSRSHTKNIGRNEHSPLHPTHPSSISPDPPTRAALSTNVQFVNTAEPPSRSASPTPAVFPTNYEYVVVFTALSCPSTLSIAPPVTPARLSLKRQVLVRHRIDLIAIS